MNDKERREKALRQALRPALEHMGYRFLELRLDGSNLTLYVDKEGGIGLEDCRRVSERAGFILEMDNDLFGDYRLEVSSPGRERPLRFAADFREFLGWEVKLRLRDYKTKKLRGQIVACDDRLLTLAVGEEQVEVELEDIRRANLIPKD